jgi:catechol 2,3-dioxygenase-like lactoylglutathione lyase family enzyme
MLNGGMATGAPTLSVGDLGREVRFFVETLGAKLVDLAGDQAQIDLGDDFVVTLTTATGKTTPITFFARGDFEETLSVYENRGIAFTREGAEAASFVDRDGNRLRIAAKR